MRTASETGITLAGSSARGVRFVADLFYDGERRAQDLGVSEVDLSWDGTAAVCGTGSVLVTWSDPFGASVVPRYLTDQFAPFGAEVQIDVILSAGSFEERLAVGRYLIVSVPETAGASMTHFGLPVTPVSQVRLELRDIMHRVGRNRFAFPMRPRSDSAWTEAQDLTGLPVVRNSPDATVPGSVLYEDNRLEAVDAVFGLMNAWPHLTATGALTGRPFAWGDVVDEIDAPHTVTTQLTSESVYNRVVVEGKAPDGSVVRGIADVVDGPLRVANPNGAPSPFGLSTYFYQSDFITTDAQAKAVADARLLRVSRVRGVLREFTESYNPLREIGDVVRLNGETVRISKISTDGATATVTVEVAQ